MGFLKRFLSLGSGKSRRNKKKQPAASSRVDSEGRILADQLPQEADSNANKLLRSSSTKFSVMSAIDYTNLPPIPPLPHSVNDLLATPPLTPTPSLVTVATTPGLSRSGTYLVKVHSRTTHSRTEFPRANPPSSPTRPRRKQAPTPEPEQHNPSDDDDDDEPEQQPRLKAVNFTPKDTSRLYKLRRDPSVASLLDLYDDHGCLDSNLFANDPPSPVPTSPATEGRASRPRTGSTFRQLLGAPEATFAVNNTAEGDLSWAERFLDEQLGDDSSLPSPTTPNLETPKDALFPDTLSQPRVAAHDNTVSSLDPDSSVNYPVISSMEVEVSEEEVKDVPVIEVVPVSNPLPDPKTPQRASEVFGFLSRRNTLTVKERDLPPPPQTITPEPTGNSVRGPRDNFLHPHDTSLGETTDATHSANTSHSSTQLTTSDTNSTTSHAMIQTATMTKLSTAFAASTISLSLLINADFAKESDGDLANENGVTSNHTDTAHATSHTTGSSLSTSNSTKVAPSRIPRGPRPRPLSICKRDTPSPVDLDGDSQVNNQPGPSRSSDNANKYTGVPAHTREAFTNIPQRQHRCATSRSSTRDVDAFLQDATAAFLKGPSSSAAALAHEPAPKGPRKRSTRPEHVIARDKENTPSPPPSLSKAASRGGPMMHALSGLMQTPVRARLQAQEPPSPASSSELSPVTRSMMSDLRQQRMRARQVERRRGVWVSVRD